MNDLLQQLDWRTLVLPAMVPVFVAVLIAEAWRFRGQGRLTLKDSMASMGLGSLYMVFDTLVTVTLVALIFSWAYQHRLFDITMTPLTGVLLFLSLEFCYYWFHRASHRIRWFWSAHVAHHSSTLMNFSTAMRQSAIYSIVGNWLFYVPLSLLGFNPVWIGVCYALSLVYQFFIHTTLVGKLHPAIEYLFNTPNHHRVHHARNPGYIDTNYGGVFIVFDRLFGTFTSERAEQPIEYGITRPVYSNSLLVNWLHEYRDIARDMRQPGPLSQRLQHLWRPPEWERPEHKQ